MKISFLSRQSYRYCYYFTGLLPILLTEGNVKFHLRISKDKDEIFPIPVNKPPEFYPQTYIDGLFNPCPLTSLASSPLNILSILPQTSLALNPSTQISTVSLTLHGNYTMFLQFIQYPALWDKYFILSPLYLIP